MKKTSLCLLLALACAATSAQPSLTDQQACGQRLLAEAVRAVGGESALLQLRQVALRGVGATKNAYQGYRAADADMPTPDGRLGLELQHDLAGGRYRSTSWQWLRGGLDLAFTNIATSQGDALTLRHSERSFVKTTPGREAAVAQAYDFSARLWPALLLRRARENLASLRCEGDARRFAFNWDTRLRLSLQLNDAALTTELHVLAPDPLDGATTVVWKYQGGQRIQGLHAPQRIQLWRRGALFYDGQLEALADWAPSDAAYAAPPDFQPLPPESTQRLAHRAVAPGLWEVTGIGAGTYRTQVVEAPTHLVVFDAPLAAAAVMPVIAHIKQHISADKPIRYVVLSHFHTDHSGGLAAYVAAGATLVVSPSDQPFVARMLAARSLLAPPLEPARVPEPKWLVVERDQDLPDTPGLRVLRWRDSPHVSDTLLLLHEPSRSLVEADFYSVYSPFNATFDYLARRLESMPVDRVLGTHHDPLPVAELQRLAADWRRSRP